MLDLSQAQLKRLTAVHGWSAVVLGLLLYAVIATGAVAVFAGRDRPLVGRQRPRARRRSRARSTAPSAASPARSIPAYLHDVGFWSGDGRDLVVAFHDHALNPESGVEDDFGTLFRVDGRTRRGARAPRRLHLGAGAELRGERAAAASSSTCTSSSTCRTPGA